MSKLIEANHETFIPPSSIRYFTIERNEYTYQVKAWIVPDERFFIIAECVSEESARKSIERLWTDAHSVTKDITIKATVEEA